MQISMRTMGLCLCLVTAACAQSPENLQPYDVKEGYLVYKAVLQLHMDLDQRGTMVIAEETSPGHPGIEECLAPGTAERFKEAITDYKQLSKFNWVLQNRFPVKRKYELVSLKALFERGASANRTSNDSWREFYQRYPESGGIIDLSVVGFNDDKTLAVVYAGVSCGSLCGHWSWHLREKKDGTWKAVPGAMCYTVS
jgi:hypothetical protein